MKHLPFNSIYRPNFEVVEQRVGNRTFFPHPDQLPCLLRALNLEFYGGLPPRLARADKRATGFDKIALEMAALMFCSSINAARTDALRLFPLHDPDLVSKVSIVQQITESSPLGPFHRFRFYAGEDFFPEIYLSGKRVAFADHVLQRFSSRVPHHVDDDLSRLLLVFYGSPVVQLSVGKGPAFVLPYQGSILAFPFKESEKEFFVTTCLTINEINSMRPDVPTRGFNLHYGETFIRPHVRHWSPIKCMVEFYECWEKKVLPTPEPKPAKKQRWSDLAYWMKKHCAEIGFGPGSRIYFVDHIPGPRAMHAKDHEKEPRFDEMKACRQKHPGHDWEGIFAQCYGEPLPPCSSCLHRLFG